MTSEVDHYRKCIRECVCPECGAGPFKSMPIHANKAHGITRQQIRARAEMGSNESITSRELSMEAANRAKERDAISATSPYIESIRGSRRPSRPAWPGYSVKKVAVNLNNYNESLGPTGRKERSLIAGRSVTPAGKLRSAEGARRWHEEHQMSGEQKAEFVERMKTPEVQAARRKAIEATLQPCGTVAAYKRGCRCEPCRSAKRASR